MAASVDDDIFDFLCSKISQVFFGRTEGDRSVINQTLNSLNALNYSTQFVRNQTKALLLINQCCSFIPTDDGVLIQKCNQLLTNLINKQHVVVEGRTLTVSIQWCLQSLTHNDSDVVLEVLKSLGALITPYKSIEQYVIDQVTRTVDTLLTQQNGHDIILLATQVLEACTNAPKIGAKPDPQNFKPHLQIGSKWFMYYLNNRPINCDELIYCKILFNCLNGLYNIIIQYTPFLNSELGLILGIIKTFMLYGIKGVDFILPQKLVPSTLSVPEVPSSSIREKKGGKLTKQRKHRFVANYKKEIKDSEDLVPDKRTGNEYTPASCSFDAVISHYSLKINDSDFSDSETGKLAKINAAQGGVRQASLNLFLSVIQYTEKSIMFSYWLSFVPEVNFKGKHNLIFSILKDPSSKVRMIALNALSQFLTSSKLYLAQAEISESTAFTPFSLTLGLTLVELHKSLSLALNEISIPVLIQVLKCFATLVQVTPYHRLSKGIITKVLRNIKPFIYHRDATIQVTALIVLGCILASEPEVPETKQALLKMIPEKKTVEANKQINQNRTDDKNIDYVEFSSDEDEISFENIEENHRSWLLDKCLQNLGLQPPKNDLEVEPVLVAPPIKLESLQVMSAMSRNYFSLMAPHLHLIVKVLEMALNDRYMDLQLHAGRTVDFIGQAINRSLNSDENDIVSVEQCLQFWITLLNGPLLGLLQNDEHLVLRAVGCNCLGSIGPQIFEQLPRDKHILCVTLLFSCTRDKKNAVRGAAIRSLAICVLYPSLREDMGFVVDTAEAIYRSLKDDNLMVRIKASWSLGNLSDALVLNNTKIHSDEDLPPNLLLKLLESGINGALDNDKIKMNAVRALGNLLHLINDDLSKETVYESIVENAFTALVRGSTNGSNMKVRWNACYALGKALKNPSLYKMSVQWQESVFNALMDLVVGFWNFKVRINAALALMSPPTREDYAQFYCPVWVSLLSALENAQNMHDYTEYKHRDVLIEQISLTLCHLTEIIKVEDLDKLAVHLSGCATDLKDKVHRVLQRLVPEKTSVLFNVTGRLAAIKEEPNVNENVITLLQQIFVHNT